MKVALLKSFLIIVFIYLRIVCLAVAGNGYVTNEKRMVTGFNALTVNGPFKLIFTDDPNSGFFIKIETDRNLQQYIVVTQIGLNVFVNIKPGADISQFSKMVLHVDNHNISALTINSNTVEPSDILLPVVCNGSHIKISGSIPISIRAKVICHHVQHRHEPQSSAHKPQIATLKVELNNARTTTLSGDIDETNIVNNGTGEVSAYNLKTNVLRVRNNSTAAVEVYGFNKLLLNNTGTGNIYYKGEGSIIELNEKVKGTVCREPYYDSVFNIPPRMNTAVYLTKDGFNTDSLFQLMMDRDQSHRQTGKLDGSKALKDDIENFACLKWYLNRHGYPQIKTDPLRAMFTILFIHIDNYENFMQIKDTLLQAVRSGKLLPNVYAYAYDRSLITKKLKPVYYYFIPGSDWDIANKPESIELPQININRTSIGLPPYPQLLNGKYF